ncbi:hypothetical protein D046_2022B, partial [Vibrio parahaemolyticus V-223/04]
RDWVKEKVEEEPDAETAQGSELNAEKSAGITQDENELYINTVSGESDTFAEESPPNEVRQNIPHKE